MAMTTAAAWRSHSLRGDRNQLQRLLLPARAAGRRVARPLGAKYHRAVHLSSESSAQVSPRPVVPHLSVSSIKTFLECPRRFYYSSLLRLPQVLSVNMVYGSAVHEALKAMFTLVDAKDRGAVDDDDGRGPRILASGPRRASLDEVLRQYHRSWMEGDFGPASTRGFPDGVKGVRDLGARHVAAFYERYRGKSSQSRPRGNGSNVLSPLLGAAAAAAGHDDSVAGGAGESSPPARRPSVADIIMQQAGDADQQQQQQQQQQHHQQQQRWDLAAEREFTVTLGGRTPREPTVVLRGVWDLLCEPRSGGQQGNTSTTTTTATTTTATTAAAAATATAADDAEKSPPLPLPTVIEFKSTLSASRTRAYKWHEPHMLQLRTYALAYRKWAGSGGGCGAARGTGAGADAHIITGQQQRGCYQGPVQVTLKSVESGEEYAQVFSDRDMAAAEQFVLDVHSQIQRSHFKPTPSYQVGACVFARLPA
jgi:hypothetical protein